MSFVKILFLGFIIGVCAVNNKVHAQQLVVVKTLNLPVNDSIYVFLPESYHTTNQIYPVVFLLHGYNGNYKQFSKISDLQYLASELNFIIVCPDGLKNSWYVNSPVQEKMQFEDFFVSDLVPYILLNYRVNQNSLYISGLSMGGHGALYLFNKYIHLFKAAGSMSGVVDLNSPFVKNSGLNEILGPYSANNKYYNSFSVINNLNNIVLYQKPIIFDCGLSDVFLDINQNLYNQCQQLGMKVIFTTPEGKHNYDYWCKSLLAHLVFFYQLEN